MRADMRGHGLLTSIVLISAVLVDIDAPKIQLTDYCTDPSAADHTTCIKAWIAAGRAAPGKKLYAPAGLYLYNDTSTIYSELELECAEPAQTIFKNNGGSGTFLAATTAVHDVEIEKCGFDINGAPYEYAAVIDISPDVAEPSRDIDVRGNRIFDSSAPGTMSVPQRQYILLLNCVDCEVIGNHLSEGGRIKVGRPGRHLTIKNNIVEHGNDVGISVVDIAGEGVSRNIVIEQNRILNPKNEGIFFGADGPSVTTPLTSTLKVRIQRNYIEGNWAVGCIWGVLPNIAHDIRIGHNECVKTGPCNQFVTGIGIRRVNTTSQAARKIRIEYNTVRGSPPFAGGGIPPLDHGGLWLSGWHSDVRVTNNRIQHIGPRAILIRNANIDGAVITGNTLFGGALVNEGTVVGTVQSNPPAEPPPPSWLPCT
jgi:hypothetical protein